MMNTEHKTIRWGILGLGKIADKFATDLAKVKTAELYAVASRSQQKADQFSAHHNAQLAYGTYQELVKDPKVDAIYIATPHSYHKEHTLLCLQHKKAVLCEKPFAMNSSEVEEMIGSAKANNTLLMEALWTYFLPHYQYVLKEIENKTFGKLLKIEADFGFNADYNPSSRLFDKSLGGGSLLDIGIYPIFAALSSMGYPDSIDAEATFLANGVDSTCDIIFRYADTAEAHLKSTIVEDTASEALFTFENASIRMNTRFHQPTSLTILQNGKETQKDFDVDTIGYSYEIEHSNQLLRDDLKESPIMSFEFSRQLIELLDKVRSQIGLQYN